MGKKEEQEMHRDERIEQTGQLTLTDNKEETSIHLLTIIGEIEGHDNLGSSSKTTKYEHILPQLAAIEDSKNISGLLVLLNTMGGDVEAGLAIAEMIASLSKPTVSLVLGGSWRPDRGERGLFLHSAVRNNGNPSGSHERDGDRRTADL
mgnify:CR=1 FL=1